MSEAFIDSFGDAFVQWLSADILPYIEGTWSFIILVASVIVNIAMLVIFRKRNLLSEPHNHLLLAFIILDIMSWIFVLIPTTIVAFAKSYILTDYFCSVQGMAFTFLYLQTFSILSLLIVERCEIIRYKKRYKQVFGSHAKVKFMIIFASIVNMGVACVPISGWAEIEYHFYHAACVCKFKNNVIYTIIVMVLGLGAGFFFGVIGFSLIFSARHEKTKKESQANDAVEARQKFKRNSIAPKIGWEEKSDKTQKDKDKKKGKKPKGKKNKTLLDDDHSDPFFHLAFTMIIIWAVLLGLWTPYFSIVLYDYTKLESEIWQGYYAIGILAVTTSFCIKPIIYVSHNRHFQKTTKEALPQNMVKKAEEIRSSVNKVLDKLDKIVFRSKFTKQVTATITAKIYGRRWLQKIRNKKKLGIPIGAHHKPIMNQKPKIEKVNVVSLTTINEVTEKNTPMDGFGNVELQNSTKNKPNSTKHLMTKSTNDQIHNEKVFQNTVTTAPVYNKTSALMLTAKNTEDSKNQQTENKSFLSRVILLGKSNNEEQPPPFPTASPPNLDLDWGIDENLRRAKRHKQSINEEASPQAVTIPFLKMNKSKDQSKQSNFNIASAKISSGVKDMNSFDKNDPRSKKFSLGSLKKSKNSSISPQTKTNIFQIKDENIDTKSMKDKNEVAVLRNDARNTNILEKNAEPKVSVFGQENVSTSNEDVAEYSHNSHVPIEQDYSTSEMQLPSPVLTQIQNNNIDEPNTLPNMKVLTTTNISCVPEYKTDSSELRSNPYELLPVNYEAVSERKDLNHSKQTTTENNTKPSAKEHCLDKPSPINKDIQVNQQSDTCHRIGNQMMNLGYGDDPNRLLPVNYGEK